MKTTTFGRDHVWPRSRDRWNCKICPKLHLSHPIFSYPFTTKQWPTLVQSSWDMVWEENWIKSESPMFHFVPLCLWEKSWPGIVTLLQRAWGHTLYIIQAPAWPRGPDIDQSEASYGPNWPIRGQGLSVRLYSYSKYVNSNSKTQSCRKHPRMYSRLRQLHLKHTLLIIEFDIFLITAIRFADVLFKIANLFLFLDNACLATSSTFLKWFQTIPFYLQLLGHKMEGTPYKNISGCRLPE